VVVLLELMICFFGTASRVRHDANTVDLHGMTLAHSLKIVEEAVNSWWANARDGKRFSYIF
jgi:hypothetical protein